MKDSTIFDDVLRTVQERLPQLLIPLINEVFDTSYAEDTEVTRLPEEYQKLVSKVVADSCNKVGGLVYHFECQSKKDGSMILRMMEYDFMLALSGMWENKEAVYLQFPKSCIIYLRSSKNMLNQEQMEIRLADGQSVMYNVPVLRLKDYSIDEIFEKNLLILLPYYIINYEKELSKIAQDEQKTKRLLEEYEEIVRRLENAAKNSDIGVFRDLARMMRRVVEYLLRKEPVLRERMSETMGGKVLRLPSDELREAKAAGLADGRREGRREGKAEGKAEATINIVQNMLKRGMSDEDICALAECDIALLEEVRAKL